MFKTIQAGRGLAALAVAAFHLSLLMGDTQFGGVAVFERWTRHGNLGVDFFFVLSGFIIMLAHEKDVGSPGRLTNYLRRRFVRVYPIYWLYTLGVLALVGLLALIGPAGVGDIDLPTSAAGWLSTFSLLRFSDSAPPIDAAWTLFHEVLFYASFGVVIFNRRLGLGLMLVWSIAIIATFQYPAEDGRTPLRVALAAYNLNFGLGMAAYLATKRLSRGALYVWGLAGAASIPVLLLLHTRYGGFALYPLAYAVAFAGLLAGAVAYETHRDVRLPVLVGLGEASYTIYLTHDLGENAILRVLGLFNLPPNLRYGTTLFMVLAAGFAIYWLVERPLLKWARAIGRGRKAGDTTLATAT